MDGNILLNQLGADIRKAMKQKDALRLSVLRMLKTALTNEKIAFKKDLTETEELTVVNRLAKQRTEAATEYRKAQREVLAYKEEQELTILQEFLPAQLSEAAIFEMIEAAVTESEANTPKDMGKVMKMLAPKIKGRADGKLVSQLVLKRLSSS